MYNKKISFKKFGLVSTILSFSIINLNTKSITTKPNESCISENNFDFVNDAIDCIQKKLSEEKHKPYCICRTYKISSKKGINKRK